MKLKIKLSFFLMLFLGLSVKTFSQLTVTVSPTANTVVYGQTSGTLTGYASGGTEPYEYIWMSSPDPDMYGWDPIDEAYNSSTYVSPALTQTTYYRFIAADWWDWGEAICLITVVPQLTATISIEYQTIVSGTSIGISVSPGGGTGSYTYQWQEYTGSSYTDISGETSSSYLASPNQNTSYRCIVESGTQTVESPSCFFTVVPLLTAAISPTTKTIVSGTSTGISVSPGGGTGSYTYQWQQSTGGLYSDISGALNSSFSAYPTQNTWYRCRVISGTQTVDSPICAVTVVQPITVTVSPTAKTIVSGQNSGTITGFASGSAGPYNYIWHYSLSPEIYAWDPVPDAENSDTYVSPPLTQTTYYRFIADDGLNWGEAICVITVVPQLAATISPTAKTIVSGTNTDTISVTSNGGLGAGSFSYQWQQSTGSSYEDILGATDSFFSESPIQNTWYRCRVASGTQTIESPPCAVTVVQVAPEDSSCYWTQNSSGIYNLNQGNIGIGTSSPDKKLTVNGTILSKEVIVELQVPAPDYVFDEGYELRSTKELEDFVKKNNHLPEIPPAKEMEANGINLSHLNMMLLKKIEELTLYIIEQENRIKKLESLASPQKQ